MDDEPRYEVDDEFARPMRKAARRAAAEKALERLQKGDPKARPVTMKGRKIARSKWGQAFCRHLEHHSHYAGRLPQGRSYVLHGAVLDLKVVAGLLTAKVHGTTTYNVTIRVSPFEGIDDIRALGRIHSVLALLQGEIDEDLMTVMCAPEGGLLPAPGELRASCTCLDWADLCKHAGAALYGFAHHLDQAPRDLFLWRGIAPEDLVSGETLQKWADQGTSGDLEGDLGDLFGIDLQP